MALLKCPDCGKMVSERVTSCPDCGCPREYFESEKKEEIPKLTFQLAGYQVDVPGEEYKRYAKVFGDFVNLSYTSVNWVTDLYKDSKNIEKALEKVPTKASEILNATIEFAIKSLYSFGIHITPEEFLEKYYYSYQIDYEQYYNTIVEGYASIMNYQNQLANYRQAQIASRGRWSGGGFGVKGAIKGAISASLMNAGSDFLHSFGDNAKKRADSKEINKLLDELYNLPDTQTLLCDSIGDCIVKVYFAMTDELKANGILPKDIFCFDKKKAFTLYEHTMMYEINHDKFVSNMIQCIELWPAERFFYEKIIGDIYACLDDSEENYNFYAYLKYWGLEGYFEKKPTVRERTAKEKEFVDRVRQAMKGTSIEKNESRNFIYVPVEFLEKDAKQYVAKVREPYIGSTIIFLSNEYILTDILISDFVHDAIMISDIKKVENKQGGIIDEQGRILDSGEIEFILNDDTRIIWNKTCGCEGRNLTALINYGVAAEDSESEWTSRLKNYDFGRGFKTNNIPVEINSEDDYVNGMKYIASVYAERREIYYENAATHLFLRNLKEWKITGTAKEISWISDEYSEEEFWFSIVFISRFRKSYINQLWLFVAPERKFAPISNLRGQLVSYGQLKLFKNFGVMKPLGFALTNQYLISLAEMDAIKLEEVQELRIVDKGKILMKGGGKEFQIKVAGTFNMNEDNWEDEAKLQHILNIIILYIIRYGSNKYLKLDKIRTAEEKKTTMQPASQEEIQSLLNDLNPDNYRARLREIAAGFEDYMKTLGFTTDSKLSMDIVQIQKIVEAIYEYVSQNDFKFISSNRTYEERRDGINMDIISLIEKWIYTIWQDKKEMLEDAKIFEIVPELAGTEYWKTVITIIGSLTSPFYEIQAHDIHYENQKIVKMLGKVGIKPNEVVCYCEIEKIFSVVGFAITNQAIFDYKTKKKVLFQEIKDIVSVDGEYVEIHTEKDKIGLIMREDEGSFLEVGITNLFVAALKQYILRNCEETSWQSKTEIQEEKKVKETIFCPYCGKQILRTAKFCNFCGKGNSYGKE